MSTRRKWFWVLSATAIAIVRRLRLDDPVAPWGLFRFACGKSPTVIPVSVQPSGEIDAVAATPSERTMAHPLPCLETNAPPVVNYGAHD